MVRLPESVLKANMENHLQNAEAWSSPPFSLSKYDFTEILENQHWREPSYFPDEKIEAHKSKPTFKSKEEGKTAPDLSNN